MSNRNNLFTFKFKTLMNKLNRSINMGKGTLFLIVDLCACPTTYTLMGDYAHVPFTRVVSRVTKQTVHSL